MDELNVGGLLVQVFGPQAAAWVAVVIPARAIFSACNGHPDSSHSFVSNCFMALCRAGVAQ